MNKDQRAEFEELITKHGLCLTKENDLYRSHVVGWMWTAYQAALASPEVLELRKHKDRLHFVADDNCSFNTWVMDDYSVKYRLEWKQGTEWQKQWYDSPEEAIDAVMEKQK